MSTFVVYLPYMNHYNLETSGQVGGIGRYTLPPYTTKRTTADRKKKQAKLPENQTVWKSYNQGIKEETSRLVC